MPALHPSSIVRWTGFESAAEGSEIENRSRKPLSLGASIPRDRPRTRFKCSSVPRQDIVPRRCVKEVLTRPASRTSSLALAIETMVTGRLRLDSLASSAPVAGDGGAYGRSAALLERPQPALRSSPRLTYRFSVFPGQQRRNCATHGLRHTECAYYTDSLGFETGKRWGQRLTGYVGGFGRGTFQHRIRQGRFLPSAFSPRRTITISCDGITYTRCLKRPSR